MLAMEEILCELNRDENGLPPGFRFHPTDEELITFYLASKVFNGTFCGIQIAEVDLNRCEPWELPDVAKMGEREWYFFSLRDRKYPTGLRTNRATGAGYWKATGKDREVYSATKGALLGMKKTLVFYKGRAPKGEKTKWVMHEYRLDGDFSYRYSSKEEWVICRIMHKIGEKKPPILYQAQNYCYPTLKTWSSSSLVNTNSPLVDQIITAPHPKTTKSSTLLQQESLQISLQHSLYLFHHQENDLLMKSLFNNNLFPMNNNNNAISSAPNTKRYKEDKQMANITSASGVQNGVQYSKTECYNDQNPLSMAFGMNNPDWSLMDAFNNRSCCTEPHMVLDSMMDHYPIKIPAESWPLDI